MSHNAEDYYDGHRNINNFVFMTFGFTSETSLNLRRSLVAMVTTYRKLFHQTHRYNRTVCRIFGRREYIVRYYTGTLPDRTREGLKYTAQPEALTPHHFRPSTSDRNKDT